MTVICDQFDLQASVVEHDGAMTVKWSLHTDLPAGTQMNVALGREYTNYLDKVRLWCGYDEMIELQRVHGDFNGASGYINIVVADRNAAGKLQSADSRYSAGVKTRVGDTLRLILIVGARQRLKAFGRDNCNLSGAMVQGDGLKYIEEFVILHSPMREEFQPINDV